MNFFRKFFRFKKWSRARKNHRLDKHSNGRATGDHRASKDDSCLQPPRFPDANLSRPMSAPSSPADYSHYPQVSFHNGRLPAPQLPAQVLERIFSYVCPHAIDHSYLSAEESTTEAGCMLCDMRDLAQCGSVCRGWHEVAERLQYSSVRLDSVHYCGLEDELQTRRNRGSFFQKKHEPPMEVPEMRMRLLYRTLQENERVACLVQFLKMPYMTRETCKADLARLVSLTPELRYCDVPEGVFSDDVSCAGLKAILYARCSELRKMAWTTGSEKNFVDLWAQTPWRNLEVVNLTSLRIENADLVRVLNSLPALQDLALKGLPWISDAVFDATPNPAGLFPALARLAFEDTTVALTLEGFKTYLSRPLVAASLTELSLTNTAISPQSLHELLSWCPSLESLTFRDVVARTLPAPEPPHLKSRALTTLRFEITSDPSSRSLALPTPSYYSYLASSLLSSSLPKLTSLYVRESEFAERLAGHASTLSHPLTIHTKSADQDHLDWNKFLILPPITSRTPGGRGSGGLEVRALWEMPRNSLVADFSDPRMSGFLKAMEWGGDADMLVPPSPGFAATQDRPRSRGVDAPFSKGQGRRDSYSSLTGGGGLAPPSPGFAKKEKRNSRHDIWR